jgi:2-iminobutanoate/2-iminopropanoate deaminase
MLKKVYTKNAPEAIGPYSQAIICGNMLFTSGQVPINPATGNVETEGITDQATQVMKNLAAVLEEAGTTFEKVVKTTCFLSDMNDFAAFNAVYAEYFTSKPARSCVAVKDIPKGCLCEIEILAKVD